MNVKLGKSLFGGMRSVMADSKIKQKRGEWNKRSYYNKKPEEEKLGTSKYVPQSEFEKVSKK